MTTIDKADASDDDNMSSEYIFSITYIWMGQLKEARCKIIKNDRFSRQKSRTNLSLW